MEFVFHVLRLCKLKGLGIKIQRRFYFAPWVMYIGQKDDVFPRSVRKFSNSHGGQNLLMKRLISDKGKETGTGYRYANAKADQ